MTPQRIHLHRHARRLLPTLAFAWLVTLSALAVAAPGAHGPNGEHLDAPATTGTAGTTARPRFESQTETFELVGQLQAGELSIFINRYESSEPVLDAKVEVQSGDRRAVATFHKDLGDYAVDDGPLLAQLSKAGEHSLIITIASGDDADLLDASLTVAHQEDGHDDDGEGRVSAARAGLLAGGAIFVVAGVGFWARRRNHAVLRVAAARGLK